MKRIKHSLFVFLFTFQALECDTQPEEDFEENHNFKKIVD